MTKLEQHRKIWQGKSDEWLFERLANELTQKVEEIRRLLSENEQLRSYNIEGQRKQMTQERFFELVYAWKDGDLTGDELYKRVFASSDVSHSCEWCGAKKENHNGLCMECGRFPSPSNFR